MQVSPSVRAVQVPDESPMRPVSTNIYLVGRDQVLTIDSGEALDRYRWMLRGYLAATEKAEIAIAAVTHHHADHSGNLKWTREIFDAEIAIPENGRPLLKGRLPAKGVHKLADGQLVELDGGVNLRVITSPGHSVDSICYYLEDEGVLFTGDTMLGSTTTTIGDLAAYRATLQRLVDLPNLKVICPGHGPGRPEASRAGSRDCRAGRRLPEGGVGQPDPLLCAASLPAGQRRPHRRDHRQCGGGAGRKSRRADRGLPAVEAHVLSAARFRPEGAQSMPGGGGSVGRAFWANKGGFVPGSQFGVHRA